MLGRRACQKGLHEYEQENHRKRVDHLHGQLPRVLPARVCPPILPHRHLVADVRWHGDDVFAGPLSTVDDLGGAGVAEPSMSISRERPNHALQRTRLERRGCNHGVAWAGSLSLGRSAIEYEM